MFKFWTTNQKCNLYISVLWFVAVLPCATVQPMISALASPPVATMPLPGEKNDRAIGGEVANDPNPLL